jgi:hypothetical protein
MSVMSGFGALAGLPLGRVNDKIERRILAGKQGMIVWWKMKAGAHAASHQHPHEQIVWMLKGRMDFRIGSDRRSMIAGDVAVIPGNAEHEGFFPKIRRSLTSLHRRVKIFSLGARRLICGRRSLSPCWSERRARKCNRFCRSSLESQRSLLNHSRRGAFSAMRRAGAANHYESDDRFDGQTLD